MSNLFSPIARAAAIAALVLGVPSAVHASGPLFVCTPGQPFLWPNGGTNIPFNPDQGSLGPLTNAQAVSLVGDAFQQWGNIPTATTTYVNAGTLPVDVDITNFGPFLSPLAPDGLSAIVFDDTGEIFDLLFGPDSGVLGFAGPEWVIPSTCAILEGLAFLNGPAFGDATEALDVLVHEFGHYQNLAHTVVNGQILLGDTSGPTPNNTFPVPSLAGLIETMYPFYFGPAFGVRTPHKDDVAGLSTLYPSGTFSGATGTITGRILGSNNTTRLTGVNVIARNIANPFEDAMSAISSDFAVDFSQGAPFVGRYTIRGLTAGAQYAVFVDGILAGGFSTPPLFPLPGPEEFYNGANESNDNDTDPPNQFTSVPALAGITTIGINIIVNPFDPGDPLPVGDDRFVQIFLPFDVALCGQKFDSVFVNANGNLTFGAGSMDSTASRAELLSGPPRIAGLWADLNSAAGGSVFFDQTRHTFSVTWENVPEFLIGGSNTFTITLRRASDHIDLTYGAVSALDGLAGVSCGGAVTSRFEVPSDLSEARHGRINLHNQPAVFELFAPSRPFDLADSTLRFSGTTNFNDRWAGHNDRVSHATRIHLPFNSANVRQFTEIESDDDVDFYRFTARAGQIFAIEILSSQLDTVLGILDTDGIVLAVDDDSGAGMLSRLLVQFPADGEFVIGVSTYPDFTFEGAGQGTGRYVLSVLAVDGNVLPVGDDTSTAIPLGFAFPFQGSNWTSLFVNGNGNFTFGAPSTDFSETVAEFLGGPPRIAPLWDDLNPTGGLVVATPEPDALTIHFLSVPEFLGTTPNNFSVRFQDDGTVKVTYNGIFVQDGLVGVTEGGGVSDPGPTDLSDDNAFPAAGTTYQLFDGGPSPFDLPFRRIRFR